MNNIPAITNINILTSVIEKRVQFGMLIINATTLENLIMDIELDDNDTMTTLKCSIIRNYNKDLNLNNIEIYKINTTKPFHNSMINITTKVTRDDYLNDMYDYYFKIVNYDTKPAISYVPKTLKTGHSINEQKQNANTHMSIQGMLEWLEMLERLMEVADICKKMFKNIILSSVSNDDDLYEGYFEDTKTRVLFDMISIKYAGEVVDYKPNGYGELILTDSNTDDTIVKMEGFFIDGELNGPFGLFFSKSANGEVTLCDGYFKDNALNGEGITITNDKTKYVGNFKDGVLNGEGKVYTLDANTNEHILLKDGYFSFGKLNGFGTFITHTIIASGMFKNDKLIDGKIVWPLCSTEYEGECSDSLPNGFGTITYSDGETFTGNFIKKPDHKLDYIQWIINECKDEKQFFMTFYEF